MPDFDFKGKRLGLGRNGPHGVRAGDAPARRRMRRGRLQPHAAKAEPLAELGATVVDSPAELADRDIVFTMVAGPEDFKAVVIGEDGLLSRSDAAPPVIVDSSTVSPDASAEVTGPHRGARRRSPGGAGERQPVRRRRRQAHGGRLRPERRLGGRPPVPRALRRRRHLRGRGRCRPARQDLPQPDARRGGPVARRDHGPGREGRRLARRVPRVPQQERHGLDVHALQDAGDREPRLHADVHSGAALQGLPPRLRGRRGAWRADAGGGGSPAGRAGADGLRVRRHDFMALLELEARGSSLELEPENVPVSDGLQDAGRVEVAP